MTRTALVGFVCAPRIIGCHCSESCSGNQVLHVLYLRLQDLCKVPSAQELFFWHASRSAVCRLSQSRTRGGVWCVAAAPQRTSCDAQRAHQFVPVGCTPCACRGTGQLWGFAEPLHPPDVCTVWVVCAAGVAAWAERGCMHAHLWKRNMIVILNGQLGIRASPEKGRETGLPASIKSR